MLKSSFSLPEYTATQKQKETLEETACTTLEPVEAEGGRMVGYQAGQAVPTA